jgi:hypothetical protein
MSVLMLDKIPPKAKPVTTGDSAADTVLGLAEDCAWHIFRRKYVVISCLTTDALIDYLLSINTHNRQAKNNQIDKIARDMQNEHFLFTSQGVGICRDVNEHWLADGQNRCYANKKAGYPQVELLIVCGLSKAAQALMDQQSKRNMADAMTLFLNTTVSTRLIAILNVIRSCDALNVPQSADYRFEWNKTMSTGLSAFDMADLWDRWEEARAVASFMDAPAPVLAAITSFSKLESLDKAMQFLEQLKTGANLSPNAPALRLTKALAKFKVSGHSALRMRAIRLTAAALKAFRDGREIKQVKETDSWW